MNIKGQGQSLTFLQGHSDSTFSFLFFLADWSQILCGDSWDGETKVWSAGPGHMTKMSAMPLCGKNLKTASSPEQKGRWP